MMIDAKTAILEPSITSTEHKGPNKRTTSLVALIAHLEEHCTGNAKGRGSESRLKPKIFLRSFFQYCRIIHRLHLPPQFIYKLFHI